MPKRGEPTRERKLALHCPIGNAPTCPACGNWNAMLDGSAHARLVHDNQEHLLWLLVCRDCGFTVTRESVTLTTEQQGD